MVISIFKWMFLGFGVFQFFTNPNFNFMYLLIWTVGTLFVCHMARYRYPW